MKESIMNIRVIEPSEGCYLTKRVREEGQEIVLSKKVILSALDSPENWVEITEEEGERLRQEEEEKMNNEQM